jgi:hypothetical protein
MGVEPTHPGAGRGATVLKFPAECRRASTAVGAVSGNLTKPPRSSTAVSRSLADWGSKWGSKIGLTSSGEGGCPRLMPGWMGHVSRRRVRVPAAVDPWPRRPGSCTRAGATGHGRHRRGVEGATVGYAHGVAAGGRDHVRGTERYHSSLFRAVAGVLVRGRHVGDRQHGSRHRHRGCGGGIRRRWGTEGGQALDQGIGLDRELGEPARQRGIARALTVQKIRFRGRGHHAGDVRQPEQGRKRVAVPP